MPEGATVLLVGDSAFGEVLKQLEHGGWYCVLRQRGQVKVCLSLASKWRAFRDLLPVEDRPYALSLARYPGFPGDQERRALSGRSPRPP